MTLHGILPSLQIILSVGLIGAILLQQSSAAMGGAFGGDNFSAGYHTRRGLEKFLFSASIALAVLFAILAFLAFVFQ